MRLTQQVASGIFFVAFGAIAFRLATDLPMGSIDDMGVGYTPRMLAVGCILVGIALLAIAATTGGNREPVSLAVVPVVLVTAMVAGFALLLPWLGLPLTVIVCVLPAAFSGETFRWSALAAMALALAALTTALFAFGLKLQIPVLPPLLGA